MKDLTYNLLHETVLKIKDIPVIRDYFPNLLETPAITDTIVLTWVIMAILIIFAYIVSCKRLYVRSFIALPYI